MAQAGKMGLRRAIMGRHDRRAASVGRCFTTGRAVGSSKGGSGGSNLRLSKPPPPVRAVAGRGQYRQGGGSQLELSRTPSCRNKKPGRLSGARASDFASCGAAAYRRGISPHQAAHGSFAQFNKVHGPPPLQGRAPASRHARVPRVCPAAASRMGGPTAGGHPPMADQIRPPCKACPARRRTLHPAGAPARPAPGPGRASRRGQLQDTGKPPGGSRKNRARQTRMTKPE